ncbi:MAG UNVERIFIED_CONTAM: hypothetical protein LVR18_50295 [Planctomycetaceae bacterium]|jgi:sialate O-acetylesterase
MRYHITLCLMLLFTSSVAANASQLKLAAVFSDHMVLQRDMPVRVWGEAPAGAEVTVTLAGQQGRVQALSNGSLGADIASARSIL